MPIGTRKGIISQSKNLILDGIPSIGTAYALHRLSSSYQGSLVQITRSDNLTLDIGFLSSGELDTNSIINFSPTSTVKIWYDQSGNGRNLTPNGSLINICNNGNIKNINNKPCLDFYQDKGLVDANSNYSPEYLFAIILSEYPTFQSYHKLYGKGWNGIFRGVLSRINTEGLHSDTAMHTCYRNGTLRTINFTNELSPINQPALIDGEMVTGVNNSFNGIGNYDNAGDGGCLLQATTISFDTIPSAENILKIRNRMMAYYSIN
jgi:Alpha-L-arabinofuranosidase B, catalytic